MAKFGNWVDAHGHLADPRWGERVDTLIGNAKALGITFFMQGGYGPEDWERQKELQKGFPENFGLCFGLHPYWVMDHSEEECESALDLLSREIMGARALGELGLDFRPHIMKNGREHQINLFEQQLEIAQVAQKPVVLHLVQAHDESLMVLDMWGLPAQKGMVHSFNGSWGKAQDFIKRGLCLSIGGPVCIPNNKKLHQAVKELPMEYLLIESDSPDQPPPAYKGQLNPPESILDVAKAIGKIKSLDPFEILDITRENFFRLFGV